MTLDDQALTEARELRSRLLELQHEADRAKLDYHHAIRRLHASGGSMREIADVLDLSHQRVHQIVEGDEPVATRMGWSRTRRGSHPGGRRGHAFGLRGRFTRGARQVVMHAQKEAHQLGADEIASEHLLLGLVSVERSGAARALAACGVDLDGVRRELGAEPVREPSRGRLPFTKDAKKLLALALREALALGHNWIGSEHVLLAMLRAGGAPVEILERLGTTSDTIRAQVERVLDAAA
jgi:DNA-binding CsgD family transcriptional regulator